MTSWPSTKPLDKADAADLILRAQAGDVVARDRVVAANMRFVFHVARRYQDRAAILDYDDLVVEGAAGVLRAISTFDPTRGVAFLTYAADWVRAFVERAVQIHRHHFGGAVHHKWLVSSRRYRDERDRLQKQGLSPDEVRAGLAKKFGITVDSVIGREALLAPTKSIDGSVGADDGPAMRDIIAASDLPSDERYALAVLRHSVRERCDRLAHSLDERERAILEERLLAEDGEELTLQDLGNRFGVSRERIRQIEVEVIKRLRAVLRAEWDDYRGIVRRRREVPKSATSVLTASLAERQASKAPAAPTPPKAPKPARAARPIDEYFRSVAFALSNMGWPKAVMARNAPVVRQAFEWEMEPMQAALRVNRLETERGRARRGAVNG